MVWVDLISGGETWWGRVCLNQEAEMNFSFKNDTLATGGGKLNQAVVEMRSYLQ